MAYGNVNIISTEKDSVAEHFLYICFLGLLASVTGSSSPHVG